MTPPATAHDATNTDAIQPDDAAPRPVVAAATMPALWACSLALVATCGFALERRSVIGGLLFTEVLLILLPALIASRFVLRQGWRQLFGLGDLRLRHIGGLVPAAIGVWLFAILVGAAWGGVLYAAGMQVRAKEVTSALIGDGSAAAMIVALFAAAVVAPVCEEVLFRGVIQKGLGRAMKPGWAIVAAALLFGAFHFDVLRFLPCAINGAAMGYATYRYRSLWAGIVVHASGNALAVGIAILQQVAASRLHG